MYHNIRLDWDPKVIGVKNGIYQVELDAKSYNKKNYEELVAHFIEGETAKQEYSEVNFKFYFKKIKSANKTSFMSFTPNFKNSNFLIDSNTLELFKSFKLHQYKTYEAVLYDSHTENFDNGYKLFYSILQDWNVIDFGNTVFISGGFGNNPKVEHKFQDENELRLFNGITKVKTLALNSTFDSSLDFFHTRLGGVFVSEKLKLALEKNGTTGIKLIKDIEVLL